LFKKVVLLHPEIKKVEPTPRISEKSIN
jgi:hypothetical protein